LNRARFVAAARDEFLAEVRYYADAESGLGGRFTRAVEEAVALAAAFPNAGFPSPSNTRRVLVQGFPFSIYYRSEDEGIVVFAIAHHARRPGYWTSRTGDR
jgi:plasmid stabilization system protein ParE